MGIKPFDLILIVSLLVGALSLWVYNFTGIEAPSFVRVYTDKGLFTEVSLHEETRIAVPGFLGESIVEVRSGKVFMMHSPCANKLCIHTGKISRCGECILCLPNRVSVVIGSRSADMDALSY
ncbi:MAG TPA: NusG domain II-containing protein [Deltaproteobacteria bacterium]|nr:NusG domain II-containing protein [Deltaproteobacteria bacterium]HQH99987.1 NusG domain II-containing protein [Deltaproteobacteria bacterium]HQJ07665.1 NusG domain II-containing protein [Deltaproteobacteria bacterium]